MSSATFQKELFDIIGSRCINRSNIINLTYYHDPYRSEIGVEKENIVMQRPDSIFITARFRSGSTLLWNIFRCLDGITAYYEPLLNEWPSRRGQSKKFKTDPTHKGVKDYHFEYRKIENIENIDKIFKISWAFKDLYMDETYFDPLLEKYLNLLIDSADGRPVLQFNRVDFRLRWLRYRYPEATILHMYRNPRDQWMSMIKNDQYIPKTYSWDKTDNYPKINTFYLWDWWNDLYGHLPFLDLNQLEHPYQIHYLIWICSYIFGRNFGHISISYEELTESFAQTMDMCFRRLNITGENISELYKKVGPRKSITDWSTYASEEWFDDLEHKATFLLKNYFQKNI